MVSIPLEWQQYMIEVLKYAGENPWSFIYYTLIILSPLFALSAYLSYKLIQEIDKTDKDKTKKIVKDTNRLKIKRKSKNE